MVQNFRHSFAWYFLIYWKSVFSAVSQKSKFWPQLQIQKMTCTKYHSTETEEVAGFVTAEFRSTWRVNINGIPNGWGWRAITSHPWNEPWEEMLQLSQCCDDTGLHIWKGDTCLADAHVWDFNTCKGCGRQKTSQATANHRCLNPRWHSPSAFLLSPTGRTSSLDVNHQDTCELSQHQGTLITAPHAGKMGGITSLNQKQTTSWACFAGPVSSHNQAPTSTMSEFLLLLFPSISVSKFLIAHLTSILEITDFPWPLFPISIAHQRSEGLGREQGHKTWQFFCLQDSFLY